MPRKIREKKTTVGFLDSPYIDREYWLHRAEILKRAQTFPRMKKKIPLVVEATKPVKEFAGMFPNTEQGIRNMLNKMLSTIQFVREKPSIAEVHYMLQTAHDIFVTKKIPVPVKNGQPLWGCNAMCIAFSACLRAKRIPYKFVRTVARWQQDYEGRLHSVVMFRLGNRTFIADPFPGQTIMQQVGETLGKQIELLKSKGIWKEGRSPEEIGIVTADNLERFSF
ncbi:MAG: hypothetical protein PHH08_00880 [Candidatus ainarchaeum sp.]|nr:hypothetical protein [Candidatus ainarchaeum sp.]